MSKQATQYLSVNGTRVSNTEESPLSLDDVFGILSNSRRRATLRVIAEHQNLDFGELVNHVSEIEYQLPIEQISSDERHRVYVSLQQTHKRTLEEHNIIQTEDEGSRIKIGPNAHELLEFMELVEHGETEKSLTDKVRRSFAVLS